MWRSGASRVLRRLYPCRGLSSAGVAPFPNSPNHRSILSLDGDAIRPFVQPNAFIAPSASVIGSVVVNDRAAVMYGAVVRGDLALIHIGMLVTVGDNSTLTVGNIEGELPPHAAAAAGLSVEPDMFIGDFTKIGPNCALSSCSLQGRNTIGACSSIGPGSKIGRHSVLAANSVVPPDTDIPPNEYWGGSPARKIRDITSVETGAIRKDREEGYSVICRHMYEFLPVGTAYFEKESLNSQKS